MPQPLIQEYINYVQSIYDGYLIDYPNTSDDLIKAVFSMRNGIRWWAINTEQALDGIWGTVRESEHITDFIIDGTCQFKAFCGLHGHDYEKLIDVCAASIGWVADSAIIDKAITERAAKTEWLNDAFKQAPWVLFIYLLSFIRQV